MPRAARACHRQTQGVQADEGRGRVLARRFEKRNAAADIRYRVGKKRRSGRVPAHAGRSRQARPPAAGEAARFVSHAGRSARAGVLASARLDDLAAGRAAYASRLPGPWLPGSEMPADTRSRAVGKVRPLGELQGEHVHHGEREPRLRVKADELSGPRADFQQRSQELSRAAAALR